jgi:NTE family protein
LSTAFVLGGGGKWGAVEVGMLRALDEAGITPDLILGTSIGAMNGAVAADQPGPAGVEKLAAVWEDIGRNEILQGSRLDRFKRAATLRPALNDTTELRAMVENSHEPGRQIEDLTIPFQCVAASIERAAEHWFVRGPLVDALMASAAVPGLFPPVEIGDEHFYDGGLVNSIPLTRAVDLGVDVIYVLQVGRFESSLRPPERLYEVAMVSFEIARRHRFATALENLPEGVDVHVLPSGNPVAFDDSRQLKWRDVSGTSDLIEGAYRASIDYLRSLSR